MFEVGIACRFTAAEVRARLVMLESQRLIVGRPDPDALRGNARRVYGVTSEGRRKVGMGNARSTTA